MFHPFIVRVSSGIPDLDYAQKVYPGVKDEQELDLKT
jgi:hypothetical protein